MTIKYGVLRGRPDRWVREEGDATPHLQIRVVDDADEPWRVAVNVQSDTGSEVVFWIVDPLTAHPILGSLPARAGGFTVVAPTPGEALDYVRAPMFEWRNGRALPASGSASADDLQDFLSLHLEKCRAAGGELYAFGAKFEQNLHKPIDQEFGNVDGLHGVHDIHMNQGNKGAHAGDNGAFHDGGVILAYADRHVGLFLGFQTQRIPTDAHGAPTPDARPLSELIGAPGPGGVTTGDVYLERALVNPTGADPGLEVVVLGNLATSAVSLDGWRLVDKNQRSTALDGAAVDGGGSLLVQLDGAGVQLGNKGGNLVLLDANGNQVDSVVYTGQDAAPEGRYVRFHR
jgi:uncharacterized protein YukJ